LADCWRKVAADYEHIEKLENLECLRSAVCPALAALTGETTEAQMKTCPDCNGDGVIDQGTDDEQRCPTCGGLGIVPDNDDNDEEILNTSRGLRGRQAGGEENRPLLCGTLSGDKAVDPGMRQRRYITLFGFGAAAFRSYVLSLLFFLAVSPAEAEPQKPEQMGTPEQRAACRADVRRLCRSVPPEEGSMALYACLKVNREKLSRRCGAVIAGERR
jgi:hypothetical protein